MKHYFDAYEREYIYDHGWIIDKDGMLVLYPKQAARYTNKSIKDPNVRTLVLPSVHGVCLIFEGLHFRVEEE